MLTSITVENFRGIERLQVEGLGRVNLIIGRNDSGKTALLEALQMAWSPEDSVVCLASRQKHRDSGTNIQDFEEFWLPVFRQMDSKRGFQIESTSTHAPRVRFSVKQTHSNPPATTEDIGNIAGPASSWTLTCEVNRGKRTLPTLTRGGTQGVQFPPVMLPDLKGGLWIEPSPTISTIDIREFSKLKQKGRDDVVTKLLRFVSDQISGIELLAPTGNRVSVFLRMQGEGLVPLLMMGEGMKRYFEFAVSLAAIENAPLYIDEIENGLHHSVLDPLWAWIARATKERNVQLFATTHSEECVQAASRIFKTQDDNGLRVIRLDKQEHETKAVVYDRDLVDAAERMGVEIRG
ncbi:DUF2813 domain-containing protein [Corallococcus sp. CA047B]|uniref:AAA family ATPase n=1 Tax=Corallococcus sp. CA047B TaxID=2316729 RepID=UPI000EA3C4F6|nr:AAA family ATPase [Corallococcus sp. CA047B]RKH04904.1 DUF2813 domain-containing protein [Corallococcus sp. CA047B]